MFWTRKSTWICKKDIIARFPTASYTMETQNNNVTKY